MSKQSNIKILYIDETCKITDVCIQLKKYYFPLPTSNTILFEQIERISLETATHANNKWGPAMFNLNNWFPLDRTRKTKNQFIAIHIKGKKIVPSFTPLDPSKVYNLLKSHFETHGLNSTVFQQHVIEQNLTQGIQDQNQGQFVDKQLKSVPSKLVPCDKIPFMQSTNDGFIYKRE